MDRVATSGRVRRAVMAAVGVAVLLAAMVVPAGVAEARARAAAPYCGITWGSLPRTDLRLAPGPIVDVRAGEHPCYDRLVVDLRSAPAPGYAVRYVRQVQAEGSGQPIPLRGGAFLQIVVRAPAYDLAGRQTYRPANPSEIVPVGGFRTFRQAAYGGSFEGYTTLGLGVRARLPFRVFALPGPGSRTRLVIDVAHRWS